MSHAPSFHGSIVKKKESCKYRSHTVGMSHAPSFHGSIVKKKKNLVSTDLT